MTVTVQLFYEPTKTMVDDFQVNSFETHDRIIKNIGNRLGVPFVAVYSQDARAQIADLRDVIQGQILLVTNSLLTRPRPYSPYGFKFYRGEEVANVHPSLPKKPWAALTEVEKKNHIMSLGARMPETRNTLRIVESHSAVMGALDALKTANEQQLGTTFKAAASRNKINMHWGVPFMLWLPEDLKPKGSLVNHQWDSRMLASLAILAKATPGQSQTVKDIIKKDVRSQDVLTEQGVLRVIAHIYERAGLVASQMTKEEKKKAKKKEYQKRRRATRKDEAMREEEVEALDALGEDAAEAAHPRGRKTGQGRQEVDELAEQLGKTKTSNPSRCVALEDDESD